MKIAGMLIGIILSCCSLGFGDSEAIVSPNANLNRYSYIAMPPLNDYIETGSTAHTDALAFKELLSELFQKEGLTVLQDYGSIDNLQALRLKMGFNCDGRHILARLVLSDATGQKVFSSTGKKRLGKHTLQAGVLDAFKTAFSEFEKYYSGFDPNLAIAYAEELKEKLKNWETIDVNEATLRNYFDKNISTLDPIEGIWMSDRTGWPRRKLGIIKNIDSAQRDFIEIRLEPVSIILKYGAVTAGFQKTASIGKYVATFYNLDGSKQVLSSIVDTNRTLTIYLTNTDTDKTIPWNFTKIYPQNATIPSEQKKTPQLASQGTGFAVSSDGLIVTAYHVIKGSQTIKVYLARESFFVAQILHSDPMNDLAILKIEKTMSNFLKVAPIRSVKTGDRVFTIGFPVSSILGEEAKYTEGVVSSLSGIKGAASFLQITVPIQPGNSGGALVSERGEVIGIITSSAAILPFIEESGTLPQNINWAIKADYLRPLIELPETEQKELSREQLIEHVKKATFIIEAQ